MNLAGSSPWWLIAMLMLVLVAAAVEDAVRLRISNVTCALVLILALFAMVSHGFPLSLWQNAIVCLAILTIGAAAFAVGLFGGGDVKLLAAIGLWLNLSAALFLLISIALAGGLLAVIYIGARKFALVHIAPGKRNLKVPYGLAIVAGSLFVFGTQLSHRNSDPILNRFGVTQAHNR